MFRIFSRMLPPALNTPRLRLPTPADKADWEFRWQQTQWLGLWNKPETQAKCLDYWRRFRHYDDIRHLVPLDDSSRVLDVGCGLSSVLHWLPGQRIGVDPLGERYKSIYHYPFEVVEACGESLPFPADEFDAVFCSNCIDHVTDPARVLAEIARVMRPGGRLILTCETFKTDIGARNAGHPHTMTVARLLVLATAQLRLLDHWDSPWYGLQGYVLGNRPTAQREHILLLEKPCA